jgi:hypothetical protein
MSIITCKLATNKNPGLATCNSTYMHINEEFATCKQGCRYHTDSLYILLPIYCQQHIRTPHELRNAATHSSLLKQKRSRAPPRPKHIAPDQKARRAESCVSTRSCALSTVTTKFLQMSANDVRLCRDLHLQPLLACVTPPYFLCIYINNIIYIHTHTTFYYIYKRRLCMQVI